MTDFPHGLQLVVDWFPFLSIPACLDHPMVLLICDDLQFIFFPSSLTHQSTLEQLAGSLIYGRHFSVNRPMDLNALLFCAWMMSEGVFAPSSAPVDYSWLIDCHCAFLWLGNSACLSFLSVNHSIPSVFFSLLYVLPFYYENDLPFYLTANYPKQVIDYPFSIDCVWY